MYHGVVKVNEGMELEWVWESAEQAALDTGYKEENIHEMCSNLQHGWLYTNDYVRIKLNIGV